MADANSSVDTPQGEDRKEVYVEAVTQGAGWMPWQQHGPSPQEVEFRRQIEARKDRMLAVSDQLLHPVLYSAEQLARARRYVAETDWGNRWFQPHKEIADYIVSQAPEWIDHMIPELTPTNPYGFTCPHCVGETSQEGSGPQLVRWDYRNPDIIACRMCGQEYPSDAYPETAVLEAPRMGQTFRYYLNPAQQADPNDRTGQLAYHWVGRPVNISFSGIVRGRKIRFMEGAAESLALAYAITEDPQYAQAAIRILVRLARCYRNWLYHDYWDTIADCDPMYAAWHDGCFAPGLELEWKRHLSTGAFANDSAAGASMLRGSWGAGRIHPSCDGIGQLMGICLAYDLTQDAEDANGQPLWTAEQRRIVQRDLILERIISAEPFLGGEGRTDNVSNKSPRVYGLMASVARVLNVPELADVALRGYEAVRDRSFNTDGFSHESPHYNTSTFLHYLVWIPELLYGYRWPEGFAQRSGVVNLYETDERLRLIYRAVLDSLHNDGRFLPLSDSSACFRPPAHIGEIGLNRYPEYYRGKLSWLYGDETPTEYAMFHIEPEELAEDIGGLDQEEVYYPCWMTALLRHGLGEDAAVMVVSFNPWGGHRHRDNLAVFYAQGPQTILGDHGYFCDMPHNSWFRSTKSHNLVVVDGAEQRRSPRSPQLRMMFTTPIVSAVEAASDTYGMCDEYRRLIVLIKGPASQTFAVDIFRVQGGSRHAYRVFSELAASDAPGGGQLEFAGLNMPPEPPLPDVRGSVAHEDLFGLRDARGVDRPGATWQATWRQPGAAYRLWLLSDVDRVEASNGPGQMTSDQIGRRVRYVQAIREGDELASTFVAVHEPSGDDAMPIRQVRRLDVPTQAGPDAVALAIDSDWGSYLLLSEFEREATIEGVVFQGKFGLYHQSPDGASTLVACGASTLQVASEPDRCPDGLGFANQPPRWQGQVARSTDNTIETAEAAPNGWQAVANDCRSYVLVDRGEFVTGYPVSDAEDRRIEVERFPLEQPTWFDFPALRFIREE